MKGYIYKITSPSGRIYIGQTINIEARIRFYKNGKGKSQKLIFNSIRKYGWKNHKFKIIDECKFCGIDNWLLDKLEIYWIEEYKCYFTKYPDNRGMNLTPGSRGGKGKIISDETKEILRQINLGKKASKETKNKFSEMRIGEGNSFYGKKHSDESIKKMSESHKGSIAWNRQKIEVYKNNILLGIFYSIIESAKQLGDITEGGIRRSIKRNSKTRGGYTFKYVTNED